MSQTSPVTARDELIKRLVGRADAHDKMCFGSPMGLGYFSGNDARLLRDAADLLRGVAQTPAVATPEMVKAAYAAYEDDELIKRSDNWLEAVINAALAVSHSSTSHEGGK